MTAVTARAQPALKRTPLYDLHVAMGARMAPFAGYEMPIQYPAGVMKEHLHTRAAASLFDVSHMGQIVLRPSGGTPADIAWRSSVWCRSMCSASRQAGSAMRFSPTRTAASSTI